MSGRLWSGNTAPPAFREELVEVGWMINFDFDGAACLRTTTKKPSIDPRRTDGAASLCSGDTCKSPQEGSGGSCRGKGCLDCF